MDTSEQFIKMCDCEEIQALVTIYDFVPAHDNTICSSGDNVFYQGERETIWLPRQDQLQEMLSFTVGTFKDNFWTALANLNTWGFSERFKDYIPMSMEQLWLAFVMKEKYNKTWDGETWK